MSLTTFLWQTVDGEPRRVAASTPLWLGRDAGELASEPRDGAVLLMAIQPLRQAVAAALVPNAMSGEVSRDGIPLAAGLHELPHGARLEIDDATYWVSAESVPEETSYQPELHGRDVYCFYTKARLATGDAITICPGTPGKTCGVIYKRASWETALQAPRPFKCPNCKFDPKQAQWQPPRAERRKRLDDLLARIRGGEFALREQAQQHQADEEADALQPF